MENITTTHDICWLVQDGTRHISTQLTNSKLSRHAAPL